MSTKNITKEAPASAQALVKANELPQDLMADLQGADAGFGTSGASEDNIVPFLSLLQDMNPEVKKRDSAYVEGAEPGCLLNKATRQLWTPDKETGVYVDVDGVPLRLQPCAFQRAILEWKPRDAGGGLVGRHEHTKPTIEESLTAAGGKQGPDPRDSSGKKLIWRTRDGNDLIDTRYHYVHVLSSAGLLLPAVMSFSSTGHQSSKAWMSLMRAAVVPSQKGPIVAPSCFKFYGLRAMTRSNNQGEWFVLRFDDLGNEGWVTEAWMRAEGLKFGKSVMSGAVRAASEDGVESAPEGDLPI